MTCFSLTVEVLSLNESQFDYGDVWSGLYEQSIGETNYDRSVWYRVLGDESDNYLKYIGGSWVLKGASTDDSDATDLLTYQSNALFPPLGTEFWEHPSLHETTNDAMVNLDCSHTYSPTNAPSDAPTSRPTFAPTSECPFLEVSQLGTIYYVNDTWNLTEQIVDLTQYEIDSWFFFDVYSPVNDRPLWVCNLFFCVAFIFLFLLLLSILCSVL